MLMAKLWSLQTKFRPTRHQHLGASTKVPFTITIMFKDSRKGLDAEAWRTLLHITKGKALTRIGSSFRRFGARLGQRQGEISGHRLFSPGTLARTGHSRSVESWCLASTHN